MTILKGQCERFIRVFLKNGYLQNVLSIYCTGGLVLEEDECLAIVGVEDPRFTACSSSRSDGSGDNQSGRRPDSAYLSLVTALSNTAVSSIPNIEPLKELCKLHWKLYKTDISYLLAIGCSLSVLVVYET